METKQIQEALRNYGGREKIAFTQGIKAGHSLFRLYGEAVAADILELDKAALEEYNKAVEAQYREAHESENRTSPLEGSDKPKT